MGTRKTPKKQFLCYVQSSFIGVISLALPHYLSLMLEEDPNYTYMIVGF
jgi:hypothetical protein